VNARIAQLVSRIIEDSGKLWNELQSLQHFNKECGCDSPASIMLMVPDGTVAKVCLSCGGDLEFYQEDFGY
jgi:hypothetical protein